MRAATMRMLEQGLARLIYVGAVTSIRVMARPAPIHDPVDLDASINVGSQLQLS
jgi:hypothetical protein